MMSDAKKPDVSYETVIDWFGKSEASAKRSGKVDSALLWRDGKKHLEHMKQQRDELLAALKEIEAVPYGTFVNSTLARIIAREAIAKVEAQS